MTDQNETSGNIALANARSTEEMHLATTNDQLSELKAEERASLAKIERLKDAMAAERESIKINRAEQSKLRRKRVVFQKAAFALTLIDQDGEP